MLGDAASRPDSVARDLHAGRLPRHEPGRRGDRRGDYDPDDDVFLFHDGVSLANLRAFRHQPE
jgi:hypothetical protein